MAEDTNNLVVEHLRHIRGRVDTLADDMSDVKTRLISIDRYLVAIHGDAASQGERPAALETRIDHLEKRLRLRDN